MFYEVIQYALRLKKSEKILDNDKHLNTALAQRVKCKVNQYNSATVGLLAGSSVQAGVCLDQLSRKNNLGPLPAVCFRQRVSNHTPND